MTALLQDREWTEQRMVQSLPIFLDIQSGRYKESAGRYYGWGAGGEGAAEYLNDRVLSAAGCRTADPTPTIARHGSLPIARTYLNRK